MFCGAPGVVFLLLWVAVGCVAQLQVERGPAPARLLLQRQPRASRQEVLIEAARSGDIERVTALLDEGADPNVAVRQLTPLFEAARHGRREVVDLLLTEGADPNIVESQAPLWIAAFYGHTEVIDLLVEAGAEVNAQCDGGSTALYVAAQQGEVEAAERLIDAGANVNLSTEAGATPLFIAAQEDHVEMARLLLRRGAQVDVRTRERQQTALWVASSKGHEEIVAALVERADVDLPAADRITPLHAAAESQHRRIAEILIRNGGANVDLASNDGTTPLHAACRNGDVEMVRLLTTEGADWSVKTVDGQTPRDVLLQQSDIPEKDASEILALMSYESSSDPDEIEQWEIGLIVMLLGCVMLCSGFAAYLLSRRRYFKALQPELKEDPKPIDSVELDENETPIFVMEIRERGQPTPDRSPQKQRASLATSHPLSAENLRRFSKPTTSSLSSGPQSGESNRAVKHEKQPSSDISDSALIPIRVEVATSESQIRAAPEEDSSQGWVASQSALRDSGPSTSPDLSGQSRFHKQSSSDDDKNSRRWSRATGLARSRKDSRDDIPEPARSKKNMARTPTAVGWVRESPRLMAAPARMDQLHMPIVKPVRELYGRSVQNPSPDPMTCETDQSLESVIVNARKRLVSGPASFLQEWLKTTSTASLNRTLSDPSRFQMSMDPNQKQEDGGNID